MGADAVVVAVPVDSGYVSGFKICNSEVAPHLLSFFNGGLYIITVNINR